MRRAAGSVLLGMLACCLVPGLISQQPPAAEQSAATEQSPATSSEKTLHGPPPANVYVGDQVCAQCHQKEAEEYLQTPHHLDSAEATTSTVQGDFTPGKNVLRTRDPNLIFAMIEAQDGFYVSAVNIADPQKLTGVAERFDIVVGSGRRGQTALYWRGDRLFQMPITWWGFTHQWVNSPGFPDGEVHFERPIIPRCLECHTTWFEALEPPNRFERGNMILGIGCEKCHGPGRDHVDRENSAHPPAPGSAEEAIVNPARLSHDRQMDLCSLCHAGLGDSIQPPLSYRPGDVLADYLEITVPPAGQPVDVHGNQASALERSKCYSSGKLTCSTCHDVHRKQEDVDAYSVHCLECHEMKACGRYASMGEGIRTKCVECHMPVGRSTGLHSAVGGKLLQAELRQHRIAVYPQSEIPRD